MESEIYSAVSSAGPRPFLWREFKAVCRKTLRTGGKILTDIAENKSSEVSPKDIVSKHVTESVPNLLGNTRGRGRNWFKGGKFKSAKKANRALLINGTSPSLLHSQFIMSGDEITSVSSDSDIFANRPIQTSVLWTAETVYKPIAPSIRTIWNF